MDSKLILLERLNRLTVVKQEYDKLLYELNKEFSGRSYGYHKDGKFYELCEVVYNSNIEFDMIYEEENYDEDLFDREVLSLNKLIGKLED